VSIQYHPKNESTYLLVMNKAASSRVDGEKVILDIAFKTKDTVTQIWDDTEFLVRVLSDGSRDMISEALHEEFLTRLAADEAFVVVTQKIALVGGSYLDGSANAVTQLRQCAYEAAELNPDDPFLQK
jgi:predicted ATP-dependent serine protease